jgi:serine/threonine-protein kinase
MPPSGEDTTRRAATRVGQVLCDKWTVDALIDTGGMAAVYAATHRNGRRVAIKVLRSSFANDESTRKRFMREGYAANAVEHPGAVTIVDDDVTPDGCPFLVMELLEGHSLETRFQQGIVPAGEMLLVAIQVLDVLIAAHDKGIVHRDIKPANVFLTRQGTVKLLDFGLARIRERTSAGRLTRAGMVFGTPSYMPPEQARAKWDLVDGRSDLWALGATMFRGLCGRTVHLGSTPHERLVAAMSEHAPALESIKPDVPRALGGLVDRALAFQRNDRWPDAAAMQQAAREAYRAIGEGPGPSLAGAGLLPPLDAAASGPPEAAAEALSVSVVLDPADPAVERVEVVGESSSVIFELRRREQPAEQELPELQARAMERRTARPGREAATDVVTDSMILEGAPPPTSGTLPKFPASEGDDAASSGHRQG